ncbi:unnamed protein product [Enterobius vermicularis]|uniref:Fork-head domain-containing protein n=1 Tax=Enterobius vermicularis TaxID=51028 RepID=A0A0N4VL99_ENTVE|nr:unnamed protein product [Enterobius vermicularis]
MKITKTVIRVLHPYYRLRPDQWGWQNSIRHNLSLHDCFVKLPLKQTSASGVMGHFWTVIPELGDKQTLRRRNRGGARGGNRNAASANLSSANNHTNNDRCGKGNDKNSQLLNKDGNSVSSDTNLSDQSARCSPETTSISPSSTSGLKSPSVIDQQQLNTALLKPFPSYLNASNGTNKTTSSTTSPVEAAATLSKLQSALSNAMVSASLNNSSSLETLFNSEEYKLYAQQLINAYMYQQVGDSCYALMASLQQLAELAPHVTPALTAAAAGYTPTNLPSPAAVAATAAINPPAVSTPQLSSPTATAASPSLLNGLNLPVKSEPQSSFMI